MSDLMVTYRGVIYPWQCDHMGHMNVMWYVSKFDEATWQLVAMLGITPVYMRAHNRGMAALEQKIIYKHELRAGDIVTVRSGLFEIKEKIIRFYHEMHNDETGEVAATTTLTGIHMDTQAHKSCPFPAGVIEQARTMIVEHEPKPDK